MKAILCEKLGDPSTLSLTEMPLRDPRPGEAKIAIKAAGINFPDLLIVAGKYQYKPGLPFIPGFEVAGIILELGSANHQFHPGDHVMAHMRTGGYAEECVVPIEKIRTLPKNFDFSQGAGFQVAFSTAYVSLVPRGNLVEGETLLVHGATGGVGLAAVQLGKALGAKVIATVSNIKKIPAAKKSGADHVIVLETAKFRDEVKEITSGRGADVIYDPVGGDVFDESLRCIAWGGRLLVVGFADGRIPTAPANLILIKGCSVVGVRAGEYGRQDPEKGEKAYQAILKLAEGGFLVPRIHAEFPLTEVAKAMALISRREVIGKVVLTP
jgi:NADPH2:quinone reductase